MVIENLNKAYYPSKIKKSKKQEKRKKKSSTPNIKSRKYPKEYVPVLHHYPVSQNIEEDELSRLRYEKMRQEEEILRQQKANIEQLKQLQRDPNSFHIIQEQAEEYQKEDHGVNNSRNSINRSLNQTVVKDTSLNEAVIQSQTLEACKGPTSTSAVEINESDDEDSENPEDENDDQSPLDEEHENDNDLKNTFVRRSLSNQNDEIPSNVVLATNTEDTPAERSAKKKGKKAVPKTIKRIFPNCTDVGAWRKRNRLEKKTRVFKMIGNYASIKKALYERGWVENKDKTSHCFDLLWTLKQRDIDYENLKDGQIVNHFRYNGVITTKVGLCRNLHKVIHFNNVDMDTFFPKCYALKDEGEWDVFAEQFKVLKAE